MHNRHIPADPSAFIAALRSGDAARARDIAAAMVAQAVPLGRQWASVARFASNDGEWQIAIGALRLFVADDPVSIDRQLALAEALSEAGKVDDAATLLSSFAASHPGDARVQHFLGVALIECGRREEGVDRLRLTLRLNPGSGQTWLALANAVQFHQSDADLAALLAAKPRGSEDLAAWYYATGKAYNDLADHEAAFAAFASGAALVANERGYDAAVDEAEALASLRNPQGWSAGVDARPTRAIFVTGKPRSGTTLVERILAAHSAVSDGGEFNLLGSAARRVGQSRTADQPAILFRRSYHDLLVARTGALGRVIDKSLNTSRHLSRMAIALPEAPVLWIRRDPLDTAWSSFRTYFARGLGWSFDFAAMARYHAIEDRLHAEWCDRYGERLMTIDYADLVERPGQVIARILKHAGLPDEEGVDRFHDNRRPIQTASVNQVNRPINRDGIGTAIPYRRHLEPFLRAYAEARERLGLEPLPVT